VGVVGKGWAMVACKELAMEACREWALALATCVEQRRRVLERRCRPVCRLRPPMRVQPPGLFGFCAGRANSAIHTDCTASVDPLVLCACVSQSLLDTQCTLCLGLAFLWHLGRYFCQL
jgi:hypothetical protein